jgi:hypothetical protein
MLVQKQRVWGGFSGNDDMLREPSIWGVIFHNINLIFAKDVFSIMLSYNFIHV